MKRHILSFLSDFNNKARSNKTYSTIGALLILLVIYLLTMIISSFRWGMMVGSPIMLYISYAINNFGLTPYGGLFDFNVPGVHFFYSVFVFIFGTGDVGFRVGDILFLLSSMTTTWLFMKNISQRIAVSAL